MNFSAYYPLDVVNGPGVRCTLFVSGCLHACPGCYNQSTWSVRAGQPFDQRMQAQVLADLDDTQVPRAGLSLTGGDPMHPANVEAVLALARAVRKHRPGKTIWCWTGYLLEQLSPMQQMLLAELDVLIDGRFEQALACHDLPWRGSSNQRLLVLKTTPKS